MKTVDNRIVKGLTILSVALGLSMLILSGCRRDIQNNDAVKQGVMTYLAKRSDLVAMDVKVMSVSYHENQATATVRFQAKGNTAPGSGLAIFPNRLGCVSDVLLPAMRPKIWYFSPKF